MGNKVGDPRHHMLKVFPKLKGTFLPQLNPVYTGRNCQHATI